MSAAPDRWTKTDAALTRLEQAIARLESAMPAADSPIGDLFGGGAELKRARQDYATLDQASRQVESRLDDMAGRLQNLLEP